jgi:hypothetical protein
MRIIETKAYTFDELSDDAKEKVIQKFRSNGINYEWWDSVYEQKEEEIKDAGFDVKGMFFSGFWSQGDGAMFEYQDLSQKLRDEYIDGLKLSPMRKEWIRNNISVSGNGKHRGNYYNEKSCSHSIYWEVDNGDLHWSKEFHKWLESFALDFDEFVIDKYEDLCRDLYKQLEKEYEYLTSDEEITEKILANEYEFTEEGNLI